MRINCDLCGSDSPIEIPCSRTYTDGQPIHVCGACGFVYVVERRSSSEIADAWSQDIYGEPSKDTQKAPVTYTARAPAAMARLTFVAETICNLLKITDCRLVDIGAGEGVFLEIVRRLAPSVELFGIEPSLDNCDGMRRGGIECFAGTIEDYIAMQSNIESPEKFDVVTVLWTLENCHSCRDMIEGAIRLLAPGGMLVVATGSRILVPFKKPLNYYFGTNPADTHSFRFSSNSLKRLVSQFGWQPAYENRYIDNDILLTAFTKGDDPSLDESGLRDSAKDVLEFFERWDKETQHYL